MSRGLRPDQIDDFVTTTLSHFIKHRFSDIALELQTYYAQQLLSEKSVKYQGGKDISYRVKVKNTGNARPTGLFAADETKVADVMTEATVPWAMQTTNFSYDIYEDLFQSDRETIIRQLQIREQDALSDMAELLEEQMWGAPTSPSDSLTPMGIPFWLQKTNSTAEGAFEGGNPSGFSGGAGGIDSPTYPRWRNWTYKYSNVTIDDCVKKTKKAIRFTRFKAPVPFADNTLGPKKCEIYTTYRVLDKLERLAETRNENLGNELSKYQDNVLIGGVPVMWVPYLENNDTSDPMYGINWARFRPFVKTSCNMRRNPPKQAARQHSVREVHYDNAMNYLCTNRRECFVGSLSS